MKILVVDDSTTMRRIIKTQLSSLGVSHIIEASNGADGLTMLAENMPVDLVTLDVNMPLMDGMACLRKIREQARFSKVKIIMVTSESEKSKVVEAVAAGATNYVVKPFTPEVLRAKLGL